jgi:hypothetical protein
VDLELAIQAQRLDPNSFRVWRVHIAEVSDSFIIFIIAGKLKILCSSGRYRHPFVREWVTV